MCLSSLIKEEAARLGFGRCGIAQVVPLLQDGAVLEDWLQQGNEALLSYMGRNVDKRIDPTLLVPGAQSAVVVLQNYKQANRQSEDAPQIAQYAYGKDYHYVIRQKLQQLLEFIKMHCPQAEGGVYTDSAPVLERAWAVKAGLGFIGKSGMLISPGLGSYTLIGVLICNVSLTADSPVSGGCGGCRACLDACPTGAIGSSYGMCTERCLSYQTIEYRGPIADQYKHAAGNRLCGCSACLSDCPWKGKAPRLKE